MIAIIAILIVPLIALIGFLYNRHRKLKAYYEIICKKSSSLKPKDVLGQRIKKYGFHEYYYERTEDEIIKEKIEKEENLLIVGNPLAGKTRAIYHALIHLDKPHNAIIPEVVDINPKDLLVPLPICFWRKSIIVLDDLDKFTEKKDFVRLLHEFLKRNTLIIASCRSGPEFKILRKKRGAEISYIFGEPIEMPEISIEEGEEVAKKTGKSLPPTFDGNIGSIFLPLETMRDRFISSIPVEKGVLRAIKRLYYAGIYREREIFSFERLKRVCQKKEIEMKSYEWDETLKELANKGFIEIIKKDGIWAEETYLDSVIEDDIDALNNLDNMIKIFLNDAEALFNIGNRACDIGIIDIKKAEYLKVAIKAYEKALEIYTLEEFPENYAMTQNNLGNAYQMLADVEDKGENCSKAIDAYEEALQVYTLERFPMDYTMTQNNLGNAYQRLADVEDKSENCSRAIDAYEEALQVYTIERFPMDYAMTQNNLGAAYRTLAEVEDKEGNCQKAIKACKAALKIRTLERFPMDYAMTQNNLGSAYTRLSEVEDSAENCSMAIEAYEEALKVYILDRFPMQYATTQNNLGTAYRTLAEVENKATNCIRAIQAFEEALKVRTLERFPMQYANTQNNMGNAYCTLAEVEKKAENCSRAIKACKKALKVRTLELFPMDYAMTQNNLGAAYQTLAEVENTVDNCKKAIRAFREALKVRTLERLPIQYATTQNNLGAAYHTLAEVEDKAGNCKRAMKAYKEALKVYTKEEFPEPHNLVQGNIRRLIAFCEGE